MSPLTYIDIHILQTVPPSNLNRDDTGSPKQAVYGGARRARVSSQAWKRATRKHFEESIPRAQLGTRTKRISSLLAVRLAERSGVNLEAATRVSTHLLAPLGISTGRKATDTAYLLFFGRPQLDRLVDLVSERLTDLVGLEDKALDEEIKALPVRECLSSGHPIDVALFGRMVADIPGLNVDAAVQVAHALSTHAVEVEFDYYTAVDDENPQEETGAGMIGTVEYNSATLYRFAAVGLHQLLDNLDGDEKATVAALETFLRSFACSMPSGHRTSFAHQTLPGLVLAIVRDDQPVNLVTAFESPVWPTRTGSGMAAASTERLVKELERATALWGLEPVAVAATYFPPEDQAAAAAMASLLGPPLTFARLVEEITETASGRLA